MKKFALVFGILCLTVFNSFSQKESDEKKLIQFSGVVVDGDSLHPLPFTSIMIKNSNRGTICDFYGYFSFVAQEQDTLLFSFVGYKEAAFIIPDTLSTNRYSLIQILNKDTVTLKETVIYPWPTKEEFRQAFITLNIPEDDYIRAQQNLARAALKEELVGTPMSGTENYNYQMRQYQSRLYYAGTAPNISLLNPIAWAQFVKAWKNGDLKKQ